MARKPAPVSPNVDVIFWLRHHSVIEHVGVHMSTRDVCMIGTCCRSFCDAYRSDANLCLWGTSPGRHGPSSRDIEDLNRVVHGSAYLHTAAPLSLVRQYLTACHEQRFEASGVLTLDAADVTRIAKGLQKLREMGTEHPNRNAGIEVLASTQLVDFTWYDLDKDFESGIKESSDRLSQRFDGRRLWRWTTSAAHTAAIRKRLVPGCSTLAIGDKSGRGMGDDIRDVLDFHVDVEFNGDRCFIELSPSRANGFPFDGCMPPVAWALVLGDAVALDAGGWVRQPEQPIMSAGDYCAGATLVLSAVSPVAHRIRVEKRLLCLVAVSNGVGYMPCSQAEWEDAWESVEENDRDKEDETDGYKSEEFSDEDA